MAFTFNFFADPISNSSIYRSKDPAASSTSPVVEGDDAHATAALNLPPTQVDFVPLPDFASTLHKVDDVMMNVPIDLKHDIVTLQNRNSNTDSLSSSSSCSSAAVAAASNTVVDANAVSVQHFSLGFLSRVISFIHYLTEKERRAAERRNKRKLKKANSNAGEQEQQVVAKKSAAASAEHEDDEEDDENVRPCCWWSLDPDSNSSPSDIIPDVYLGGLKIWSCTLDVVAAVQRLFPMLARHGGDNKPVFPTTSSCVVGSSDDWLAQVVSRLRSSSTGVVELNVADIGCGHGLNGIAALKSAAVTHGAVKIKRLLFHDFNEEIATTCVAGTVRLNRDSTQSPEIARAMDEVLVASAFGNWNNFSAPADGTLFDLVVASDVSYDDASAAAFMRLLKRILRPKTGVALVGTKEFYFGTNGGTSTLLQYCGKEMTQLCDSGPIAKTGGGDMLRRVVCLVRE